MENKKENSFVDFDNRLDLSLDFVCKRIDVSRKDFATLALANLLTEELDHIQTVSNVTETELLREHKKIGEAVKYEANNWVIK